MDFNSPLTHKEPIVAAPPAPSVEREPNVSATSPCTRCGTTEPPDEQGLCPAKSCRAARVGNKLASVHDGRAKLTPADLVSKQSANSPVIVTARWSQLGACAIRVRNACDS